MSARRVMARRQRNRHEADGRFPRWPIEPIIELQRETLLRERVRRSDSGRVPVLGAWPGGHRFAWTLTHDVEGPKGLANVGRLLELERRHDAVSAWFLVADDYDVGDDVLAAIRGAGGEIGLHGLHHDGRLFQSREHFERQLPRIHDRLRAWDAVGFRSPATHRNAAWMPELGAEYDSSFPDTHPFDAQPGGCCSILPYFLGDMVELPITLPQDHTLFELLGERNIALWRRKVAYITACGGLVHGARAPGLRAHRGAPAPLRRAVGAAVRARGRLARASARRRALVAAAGRARADVRGRRDRPARRRRGRRDGLVGDRARRRGRDPKRRSESMPRRSPPRRAWGSTPPRCAAGGRWRWRWSRWPRAPASSSRGRCRRPMRRPRGCCSTAGARSTRCMGKSDYTADPERDLNTGVELITLEPVAAGVRRSLGLHEPVSALTGRVTTAVDRSSSVVSISAHDASAARAARIANAFAAGYRDYRSRSARSAVRTRVTAARVRLRSLSPGQEHDELATELRRLQVAGAFETGGVQVVHDATAASATSKPRPAVSAVIGGLLGVDPRGAGRRRARAHRPPRPRRRRARGPQRVPGAGAPAGLWPRRRRRARDARRVDVEPAQRRLAAGARAAHLARAGGGHAGRRPRPARALGSIGRSVIAIEADLRTPAFAHRLGLGRAAGLVGVLDGEAELERELVPVGDGAVALPAGEVAGLPQALLAGDRMSDLVEAACGRADVILIAGAPLGVVGRLARAGGPRRRRAARRPRRDDARRRAGGGGPPAHPRGPAAARHRRHHARAGCRPSLRLAPDDGATGRIGCDTTIGGDGRMTTQHDVAVIGAGPYGLSATAHLRAGGLDVHTLGRPMELWEGMPPGMFLRSSWEASTIADPDGSLSLDAYEAAHGDPGRASDPARGLLALRGLVPRVGRAGRRHAPGRGAAARRLGLRARARRRRQPRRPPRHDRHGPGRPLPPPARVRPLAAPLACHSGEVQDPGAFRTAARSWSGRGRARSSSPRCCTRPAPTSR